MKQLLLISAAALLMACSAVTDDHSHDGAADHSHDTPTMQAATSAPDIKTQDLGDGFYMLEGPGGNIGLSIGEDGVHVVDDKYARFADQILFRIREITDQPIRFVLNTHYHGDHAGANAEMKETGATVMAHDNVRMRMGMTFENKTFSSTTEATNPTLWPTLTFSETATLHFNGQEVKAHFMPGAHTDGDTIVTFQPANLVHMGDTFFNQLFPVVDVSAGGTMQGMIAAQDWALARVDETTRIIPGHGPMATKADLQTTRDALADVLARVKKARDAGESLEEAIESVDLTDYASFSWFIDEAAVIKAAYWSLDTEEE